MSLDEWNPTYFQIQLRTTVQRLGQLQAKKDTATQALGKEIADLLNRGRTNVARSKARQLLQEDAACKLLEVLEMLVGVVNGHLEDLSFGLAQTPAMVEAAASIIYAAPRTESTDLNVIRGVLIDRLGPDFARSAIDNSDSYVSPHVLRALFVADAILSNVDPCLEAVARQHGVQWYRPLQLQEKQNSLFSMLDTSSKTEVIHTALLKRIAAEGLPDDPSWMRPRTWRLLAEVGAVAKDNWQQTTNGQRQSYYELVARLLAPLATLSEPNIPLIPLDRLILNIRKTLLQAPPALTEGLASEPRATDLCPLNGSADETTRVAGAGHLSLRTKILLDSQGEEGVASSIPEIRLSRPSAAESSENSSTTIHPSSGNTTTTTHMHIHHWDALSRLLFVHASVHPGTQSPHTVSLLIPIYRVLLTESELSEVAHAEADAFWMFERMLSEFSDLEDSELGTMWMRRLSERLSWADPELFQDLHRKGLDPGLPHYSYRWLATVLTHTLPFESVIVVWDVLLSLPARQKDLNPKIERLVDVCTSMLVKARYPLFRLGKSGRRSPSLWKDEPSLNPPPSPSRAWELGDAFNEGVALLQNYPIADAGGIHRILETASELARRREVARPRSAPVADSVSGLGTRLKDALWNGFTSTQSTLADDSSSSDDETGEEDDLPSGERSPAPPDEGPTFASLVRNTVWKGITNQAAMEVPPTPLTPTPHSPLPTNQDEVTRASSPASPASPKPATSGLWNYAQKLSDSDTAAKLARTGTNWKAMAMEAWNSRKSGGSATSSTTTTPATSPRVQLRGELEPQRSSLPFAHGRTFEDIRRGSLPDSHANSFYTPPARPRFKPPRDSILFVGGGPASQSSGLGGPDSEHSESIPASRGKILQTSLAALTGIAPSQAPKSGPRSGPRPLLLNSSSLITSHSPRSSVRPLPSLHERQSSLSRSGQHVPRHESQSSLSSLRGGGDVRRTLGVTSDGDSDSPAGASRVVHLNRRSVSPMAPTFKHTDNRSSSVSSTASLQSPDRHFAPQTVKPDATRKVYTLRDERPDSPATLGSSSPPQTPVHSLLPEATHLAANGESEAPMRPGIPPPKSPILDVMAPSPSTPPSTPPARSPRVRSKRHVTPKVPNLKLDSISSLSSFDSSPTVVIENLEATPDYEPSALTPRAGEFETPEEPPNGFSSRLRKMSNDSERRMRRPRKLSGEGPRLSHASSDGDDEGYDGILNTHDSEEER